MDIVLAERSQPNLNSLESGRCFNFSHLCVSTIPSPVIAKKCGDKRLFSPSVEIQIVSDMYLQIIKDCQRFLLDLTSISGKVKISRKSQEMPKGSIFF